jgi:hypothetical protein
MRNIQRFLDRHDETSLLRKMEEWEVKTLSELIEKVFERKLSIYEKNYIIEEYGI